MKVFPHVPSTLPTSGSTCGSRTPASPSTTSRWEAWKNRTAASVLAPKIPSGSSAGVAPSRLSRSWTDQLGNITVVSGVATGTKDFNMSTVNGISQGDTTVQGDIALGSGQSAGLVARYSGPLYNNFYLAQLRDIGGGSFPMAFGSVPLGASVLMADSEGRLSLADNQGDAARRLGLSVDRPVTITAR